MWPATDTRGHRRHEIFDASVAAHQTSKSTHDTHILEHVYTVGDRVWVRRDGFKKGESRKLAQAWEGPYKIVEKLRSWTYRVQREGGSKQSVIHHNRLKPCTSVPEARPGRPPGAAGRLPLGVRERGNVSFESCPRPARRRPSPRPLRPVLPTGPFNPPRPEWRAVSGDSTARPESFTHISSDDRGDTGDHGQGGLVHIPMRRGGSPLSDCGLQEKQPLRRSGRVRRPPERFGNAVPL